MQPLAIAYLITGLLLSIINLLQSARQQNTTTVVFLKRLPVYYLMVYLGAWLSIWPVMVGYRQWRKTHPE